MAQLRSFFRHARQTMGIVPVVCSCLICGALFVAPSVAQVRTDSLTTDQLFLIARDKAFAGEREEARRLCRVIVARDSSYLDAKVLLGRMYAWDGNYAEARSILRSILSMKPIYRDALDALLDVELWDKDFVQALEFANLGLTMFPHDVELLIKKSRALNGLGRDEESIQVLLKVEEIDPSRTEVSSMMESIKAHSVMNSIGASYAIDHFSDAYDDMHYLSLQYSRQTPHGPVYARVNYSSRFHERGVQMEAELYPRIADGLYAYVDYAYSQSILYPKHRVGAEVYGKLPANFEASIGLRHFYFGPSSLTIYTGTLGYYVGNYWLSFRPYFIPNDAGLTNSASITLRRYFGDAETYASLHAGAGFSADERTLQSSTGFIGQQIFFLKSQTIGLGWQQNLSATSLLNLTIDLTNQELSFNPGNYVVMSSLSIGLRTRF